MVKRKKNREDQGTPPQAKQPRNENEKESEPAMETDDDSGSTSSAGKGRSQYFPTHRSGKILSMRLKNFMCHRNLSVDFNRQTNLIVGKNGSGKSAILTALIIGLGSKANATDRSHNIKQLIRRGESTCTIEVHISNDGDDAYEHQKYGDRIVVVRQLMNSGGSTYKLKSQWGNVISTSRAELLRLILYMNIQVDNPVCVLTQDASRSFLRDSNPKKRFELFQRATQMDVVTEKLFECNEQILKARQQLEFQEKITLSLKDERDKAQEKYAQFQSVEAMKEENKVLKCQMGWLSVIDQEKFIAEIQKTSDDTMQQKEKLISASVNSVSIQQKLRDELAAKREELKNGARAVDNFDAKFEEMRKSYKEKNEIYLQKVRETKRIESKKKRIEDDLGRLKEHLVECSQTTHNEMSKLRKDNENKLAEYKEQLRELTAMQAGAKRDLEMFSNTKEQLQKQCRAIVDKQKQIQDEISHLTAQQKTIVRDPRHNLELYGNYMPGLVAEIEKLYKDGKFNEMPLGPIGSFIEVNDSKYLKYVEEILGKFMKAFYVNDAKDGMLLSELFKKYPQTNQCPIITSRFINRAYDVNGKNVRSDAQSRSVMDLINVKNQNVMNCLIDHLRIETILITNSQEHAVRLTSRKENVPANLTRLIVTEPYRVFFPAPLYRSYGKKAQAAKYLQPNMAQREKYLKTELEKRRHEHAELDVEKQKLMTKGHENEKLLKNRRERLAQLNTEMVHLQVNIQELQDFEYPAEDENIIMEKEIDVQTKTLQELEKQLLEENGRCEELKLGIDAMEANIRERRRENQEYKDSLQDKQRELDSLTQEISNCDSAKMHSEVKLQKLEQTITKLNKELSTAIEKLQRLVRSAEKIGARIESDKSLEDIQRKIKINERKIGVISNLDDNMEEVEQKLHRAEMKLEENTHLVNAMTQTIHMLRSSTKERFQNTKKLMHYTISQVSYQFQRIVELRGYKGSLLIDTNERTLTVEVVPRAKGVENANSKTSSLSGGERSYSTVAFLISLWTCVDNPFYFLDEYDVFTDEVNRMYMTKLLINEATKKPFQQYAFLTPQDTEIQPSDSLTVLKMKDPGRS